MPYIHAHTQHQHASPDLTSMELRQAFRSPSPAPTYRTTNRESFWPTPPATDDPQSNSPYHHSPPSWHDEKKDKTYGLHPAHTNPTGRTRGPSPRSGSHNIASSSPSPSPRHSSTFAIKPDPRDPSHPHYADPSPQSTHPLHPAPPRRPLLRRTLRLLPTILATAFLLSTLSLASLLLGYKFLSENHPIPAPPTINLVINGYVPANGTPTMLLSTVMPAPTGEGQDNTGRPVGMVSVSARGWTAAGSVSTPAPGVVVPPQLSTLATSTISRR